MLSLDEAPKMSVPRTKKNTHTIIPVSQYRSSKTKKVLNMSHQSLDVREEHVFEIRIHLNEAVARRLVLEDVEERPPADQLRRDHLVALFVFRDICLRYRLGPDASMQGLECRVRSAAIQHTTAIDEGHVRAKFFHVINDVRREDDDYVLANLA